MNLTKRVLTYPLAYVDLSVKASYDPNRKGVINPHLAERMERHLNFADKIKPRHDYFINKVNKQETVTDPLIAHQIIGNRIVNKYTIEEVY